MIYNTAVKKDTTVNESAPSLLEAMLYIAESEGKMFDSLINIDFMDALNEADLSDQEEDYETGNGATQPDQDTMPEEKKNKFVEVIKQIASKIWELLTKVGGAIKKAFEAFFAKAGEVLGTTKGIISKYGKYVTDQANLEGFSGLNNFPAIKDLEYVDKQLEQLSKVTNYKDMVNAAADIPDKDAEERKAIIDKINSDIENNLKITGEVTEDALKLQDNVVPTASDMKEMIGFLDQSGSYIKGLKDAQKEALQAVEMARQSAKKQQDSVGSKIRAKADGDYVAAWKDYYGALATISKHIVKLINIDISLVRTEIKFDRRAVIEVGKYAFAKANGKEVNEESYAFAELLGCKSDAYVESVLSL